jgi:hypothetical protein
MGKNIPKLLPAPPVCHKIAAIITLKGLPY